MKSKPFYRSRTFWGTALAAAVRVGVAAATGGKAAAMIAGAEWAPVVLAAVGLRAAVSKNGSGA